MPHALRQGITTTSKLRYLDARRLAARHAAEDWFEARAAKAAAPAPAPSKLADTMMAALDSRLGK